MRNKKYFISTAFYPAEDGPQIENIYSTLAADVLARHLRARDIPVHFRTGVSEIAQGSQTRPGGSDAFRALWKTLNVKYDSFISNSATAQKTAIKTVFERLTSSGDIYSADYSGLFCQTCATFYEDRTAGGGRCPIHGPQPRRGQGKAYFFRLSKYGVLLLEHHKKYPDFISPRFRAKELIDNIVPDIKDIAVSPTHPETDMPACAWFRSLLGYVVSSGYSPDGSTTDSEDLWPADAHIVGGEDFRYYGVILPSVLMALGMELPRKIYAHGRWTINGGSISGAHGNFIKPEDVIRDYGADALRHFILREVPFGLSGDFSMDALKKRYDSELDSGLERLFSRLMSMTVNYLGSRFPEKPSKSETFRELSLSTQEIDRAVQELRFADAMDIIWSWIGTLNRNIDKKKPAALAKRDPAALVQFVNEMIWCLRLIAGWLDPFMPDTASKMHLQLGVGMTAAGVEPQKSPPLFPHKHNNKPFDPRIN